jgi:hypothetical protein
MGMGYGKSMDWSGANEKGSYAALRLKITYWRYWGRQFTLKLTTATIAIRIRNRALHGEG